MGTVHSSSCTSSASASPCSSPRSHFNEQQQQPTLDETINRILKLVGRKPVKNNYGMQRAVQLLASATSEEKEQMLQRGVLRRICLLINEHCNLDLPPPPSPIFDSPQQHQRHSVDISVVENNGNLTDKNQQKSPKEATEEERESRKKFIVGSKSGKSSSRRSSTQQAKGATKDVKQPPRKRPGSAEPTKAKGVGYGRGSTKSRWNMERTVEERSIQEEHLIWLLSALIAYLWGDRLLERVCDWEMSLGYKGGERRRSVPSMFYGEMPPHLEDEILAEQILHSQVFSFK
uniref:Uncharacterized protein n=1 Tax=Meloidogyne hapla TaxID=6305 RepID=A0A1I8BZC0_MELHA